jgi:methyl-accepting chemotaxis protein
VDYIDVDNEEEDQYQNKNNKYENKNNMKSSKTSSSDVTKKAAIAGAILGNVIGGPIGAIAIGTGAALVSNRNDELGDAAKTMAKAIDVTTNQIKNLDKEYHIIDKSSKLASNVLNNSADIVKKVNNKLGITSILRKGLKKSLNTINSVLDTIDNSHENDNNN